MVSSQCLNVEVRQPQVEFNFRNVDKKSDPEPFFISRLELWRFFVIQQEGSKEVQYTSKYLV